MDLGLKGNILLIQDYTIDLHFCNCIFRFSTEPVVFGSFPKFHKRNINTEIILKLGCNFCRRFFGKVYPALHIMSLAIRSPNGRVGGTWANEKSTDIVI